MDLPMLNMIKSVVRFIPKFLAIIQPYNNHDHGSNCISNISLHGCNVIFLPPMGLWFVRNWFAGL